MYKFTTDSQWFQHQGFKEHIDIFRLEIIRIIEITSIVQNNELADGKFMMAPRKDGFILLI